MSEFFEFDIIPSDDPDVREADQGFLTEVSWTVTAPEGGKSHGVRRVLVPSAADAVVQLGLLSQPEPVAPYTGGYALAPDLAAEVATRAAADTALDGRVDALEVAPPAHTHPLADVTDAGTAAAADVGDFATAAQGALADSATQPGDLATVATTGVYADLSGKPTLGTAAATASTDYATAAQGVKADSAVQPARTVAAGTGLTGGGDLSADRTLTVAYGTTAGTAAQGNDSRIVGALQPATVTGLLAGNGTTTTGRTITGTTDEITVTNGSGASGNPTLSLALTAAKVGALPIPDPGSYYPTDTIAAALQLIGGREQYGTGSPEGVVTALVGAYYTDTAGTNGAWRWLKKTGTGNTGWSVIDGDTGIRSLNAVAASGVANVALTYARVARSGNTVEFSAEYTTGTTAPTSPFILWTPPVGFQPLRSEVYGILVPYATAIPVNVYVGGNLNVYSQAANSPGTRLRGVWITNDAWPTTLPGTAA